MTTADSVTSPPSKRVKTTDEASNMTSSTTTTEQAPPLLIKKLSDKARLPTRGSAFAAGYDVYAAKETTIPARGKALVDTDIAISVPAGTCKRLPLPCFRTLPLSPPADHPCLYS